MAEERTPTPAELVKQLRQRYGSHDKLAAALGTSRTTVIRWEQGRRPKPDYAAKLAELDGDHSPDAFRVATVTLNAAEVDGRLDRIEAAVESLAEGSNHVDTWVQLGTQTMKNARVAKGWSHETVGRKIGEGARTYARWEKDGRVRTYKLEAVADALGISIERKDRSVVHLDEVRTGSGEEAVGQMFVRVADQLAKQTRILERMDETETRLESLLRRVETAIARLERAAEQRPA